MRGLLKVEQSVTGQNAVWRSLTEETAHTRHPSNAWNDCAALTVTGYLQDSDEDGAAEPWTLPT